MCVVTVPSHAGFLLGSKLGAAGKEKARVSSHSLLLIEQEWKTLHTLQGELIDHPSVLLRLVCSHRNQDRKNKLYLTQEVKGVIWMTQLSAKGGMGRERKGQKGSGLPLYWVSRYLRCHAMGERSPQSVLSLFPMAKVESPSAHLLAHHSGISQLVNCAILDFPTLLIPSTPGKAASPLLQCF